MPVQIGQKRESDFSDPLGLLSDCHRRIERFLNVLIVLADRFGGPLSPAERSSLEKSLVYFQESAPKHTADEEESLFPRLRSTGKAEKELGALRILEGDHREAASDHGIVDVLGRRWLRDDALMEADAIEWQRALDRLSSLYRKHIALEDQHVFPLAANLLSPEELATVGREMADRRGVKTRT